MGRPNKKNTIISIIGGEMGSVEIVVHYQGSRGVIREDYDDYNKFLEKWCSIDDFWEKQSKVREHEWKPIKFNYEAKARISQWLEQTKDIKW